MLYTWYCSTRLFLDLRRSRSFVKSTRVNILCSCVGTVPSKVKGEPGPLQNYCICCPHHDQVLRICQRHDCVCNDQCLDTQIQIRDYETNINYDKSDGSKLDLWERYHFLGPSFKRKDHASYSIPALVPDSSWRKKFGKKFEATHHILLYGGTCGVKDSDSD